MKIKVRVPFRSKQAWSKSIPHKRKDKILHRKKKHKKPIE